MNNQVVLNEQSMEDAASKIRLATEEIKNSLDVIKSEIHAIDQVWKDQNASVYMQKFEELHRGFPGFYTHAYELSNFLNGVVKAYRENVLNPTKTAVNGTDSTNA